MRCDRIRIGILKYNTDVLHRRHKYHETVTVAFARIVADRMRTGEKWDDFARRIDDLLNTEVPLLLRYYSKDRLFSEAAREAFLEPDLEKIPSPDRKREEDQRMAELKTKATSASASAFLNAIDDKNKRADCKAIAKMMRDATGKRAKMWGKTIVGYDTYDYVYASGRIRNIHDHGFLTASTKHIHLHHAGFRKFDALMKKLGKYKTGKSCLYIKKLDDVDQKVLSRLIKESVKEMRRRYNKKK